MDRFEHTQCVDGGGVKMQILEHAALDLRQKEVDLILQESKLPLRRGALSRERAM